MLNIKKQIANEILCRLPEGAGLDANAIVDMLEYPPDLSMGDLAFPCFKLSRTLRKGPPMIAAMLGEGFACPAVEKTSVAGGYLNFTLSKEYLTKESLSSVLADPNFGSSNIGQGKMVVLDYSSPNICKPFHIGHLGTTVIGHSLKKLHEFVGYDCYGINYLGDWGTQFGKLITAYRLWGSEEEVEKGGIDYLVDIYVRFHKEAEEDPTLNDRAREEFHKLELGDEENLALWHRFKEISLEELNEVSGGAFGNIPRVPTKQIDDNLKEKI
jgi:arginyl-tRNA synthetase